MAFQLYDYSIEMRRKEALRNGHVALCRTLNTYLFTIFFYSGLRWCWIYYLFSKGIFLDSVSLLFDVWFIFSFFCVSHFLFESIDFYFFFKSRISFFFFFEVYLNVFPHIHVLFFLIYFSFSSRVFFFIFIFFQMHSFSTLIPFFLLIRFFFFLPIFILST